MRIIDQVMQFYQCTLKTEFCNDGDVGDLVMVTVWNLGWTLHTLIISSDVFGCWNRNDSETYDWKGWNWLFGSFIGGGWQHLLFGLAVIIAIGRTGINKSITISRNAVEWYAEAYSKFHNFWNFFSSRQFF